MKSNCKRITSVMLSILLVITMIIPGFVNAYAAGYNIIITDKNGNEITERLEVQEYRSVQLGYTVEPNAPEGSYVVWESNLPLLADVDDSGKVTGYDYSKAAIIQLWLDEEVRSKPIVGETTAKAIENAFEKSGIDLETANTDLIVAVVSGVSPEFGESLRNVLDNMNIEITATLYDSDGNKLSSDKVEVVVTQSIVAQGVPTGVHITNRKKVPTTVAVGSQVQLYAAVTPVRLAKEQNLYEFTWSAEKTKLIGGGDVCATVDSNGLVTFTGVGEVKIVAKPKTNGFLQTGYQAFSASITFNVVDQSELTVNSFDITGELSVSEGETTQLSISNLDPAGAYIGDAVWTSADTSIAVVDNNGVVTGLDGGTINKKVDITATIGDISRTVNVTVKRGSISGTISGIEINGESVVGISETSKYSSNVYPSRFNENRSVVREWGLVDQATGDKIWATSTTPAETELATITSDGMLTSKSNGLITIIARATYNDTVVENVKEVISGNAITDFTITGSNEVTENKTIQLSIENIIPADYDEALLSTLKWSVEDPKIASVDKDGVVKGLDGGGLGKNKTTTVYATIGGVKRSFVITVKGAAINYVTSALIKGPDYVIKDFPVQFEAQFTPERLSITKTLWGLTSDEGVPPWSASNTLNSSDCMENTFASVTDSGLVTGKTAGETTLHLFGRRNLTSNNETSKEIKVVEIEPASISITAPSKNEYIEGQTELDLSGMKVELTYNRSDIEEYYGDTSGILTDSQLKVEVSDYSVSAINQSVLDTEQFIVVNVVRAGKTYRGVFAITLISKELTSIDIVSAPQHQYVEGVEELNLADLKVKANYSNAESEFIDDYFVDTLDFDTNLFDVEQMITVDYSHAGRSASATFPVIIYGIPVISVSTGDYEGGWTNGSVTFDLDSTHKVDGITYYYKTETNPEWVEMSGDSITVDTNISETYYFKAVNGKNIESVETIGYTVNIDNVTPEFSLTPEITEITNSSYLVNIDIGEIGASGIGSISVNGTDITGNSNFVVEENGTYTVKIVSVGGLTGEKQIVIDNIDKQAPTVLYIDLDHKNTGGFARKINELTFGLFFKEKIVIYVEAEDYGVAGIDKIEYRFVDENGNPISDWQTYSNFAKPEQEPNFKGYVEARAIDKAGNVSSILRSDGYVIDDTAPTDVVVTATTTDGEYANDTWTSNDVTLVLSSTAFSEIYKYYYKLNDGKWIEMDGDTLTVSKHGVSEYQFKAVSYSTLESNITNFTVKIDKTVPVVRVDFEGTFGRWTSGNVKFSFSLLNEAISGVTYYYDNGNGWTEITSGNEIYLNENVNSTYVFKAVNGAGIESNPSDSYVVMIDNVAPSITFNRSVTEATIDPYDVSFDIVCGEAGLESISVNGTDITGEDKITVSENGIYTFVITGKNGKTSAQTLVINNFVELDFKIKSITFKADNEDDYKGCNPDDPYGMYFSGPVTATIELDCNLDKFTTISYKLIDAKTGEGSIKLDPNKRTKSITVNLKPKFMGKIEAVGVMSDKSLMLSPDFVLSESFVSEGITIDNSLPTAPVISALEGNSEYDGEWTGNGIDVSLSSTVFSGVKGYLYSVDGGEYVALDGDKMTITQEGIHTYSFKAVSNTGIIGNASELVTKIESAKPSVSVNVDGMLGQKTSEDVVFTLSSTNTASGVTYYYNNGNGWQRLVGNVLTVSDNCNTEYVFKAVNGVGNESELSPSYSVNIDKDYILVEIKPVLNVQVNGTTDNFTSTPVVFTVSSTETDCDVTYYCNDGNGWKALSGNTFIANTNGVSSYKFKAVDAKGRESLESSEYIVKFDNVVPTVSAKLENTEFTNTETLAKVTATVGASGIKEITVNGADITNDKQFVVDENGNYSVTVVSNSGLSATSVLSVNNFDKEAPVVNSIDISYKNNGSVAKLINTLTFGLFFNETAQISITATDIGVSGIKEIKYRLLDENGNPVSDWVVYYENDKPCIDAEFKGYVQAVAYDNANNTSAEVVSTGFIVDLTSPEGMSVKATVGGKNYDGKFTADEIVLTPYATAFSDISYYMYSVDNGEWNVMTTDFIKAADGVHSYSFKAVSNAGLESNEASVVTKREVGKPKLEVVVSGTIGEWTADNVVFTLNATNGNSGMTYYYDNGDGWVEMQSNVLVVSENVNTVYKFKCVNGVDTQSDVSQEYLVMIDNATKYEFTVSACDVENNDIPFGTSFINEAVIVLSAEAYSGEVSYQYSLNGGEWIDMDSNTLAVTDEGTFVYSFRAVNETNMYSETVTIAFSLEKVIIPEYKIADVNLDGSVTIIDAKWVLQYVAGTRDLSETQFKAGDVNKDENLTIVDAKWILQIVAGTRDESSL